MKREEAVQALNEGKKVRHAFFTPDEWVKREGHFYVFEDGCICMSSLFWESRTGGAWESNWSVVE